MNRERGLPLFAVDGRAMRKTRTRHDEPDLTPTSDLRPPSSGRARPPGGTLFSRLAFLTRSPRSSRSVRSGRARPPGGPLRFGGRRDDKTTRQRESPQLSFGTTGRAFPSFRQPVVPSSSRSAGFFPHAESAKSLRRNCSGTTWNLHWTVRRTTTLTLDKSLVRTK